MKIAAKIYKFDTPNANGIIYDTDSLKQAVEEFNKVERFAVVRGEAPKKITADLTHVKNIVGPAKLAVDGEYVIAIIDTYPNGKGHRAAEVFDSCTENLKIMPIATCSDEAKADNNNKVHVMSVAHIVCTCDDIDCGDVEEDMFIAFPVN